MPRIEVDANKCKACYLCVNACPKKCLGKSKTISKKGYFPAEMEHPENCIGCAMCYMMCPDIAITVIKGRQFKDFNYDRKNITKRQ